MKDEQGFCPICNTCLTGCYSGPQFNDDELYFEWNCKNCQSSGEEYYTIMFDGHENLHNEELEIIFDVECILDIEEDELNEFIEAKKYNL